MSLEHWEIVQRQKGNLAGAEMARVLREQYGDVDPLESIEGGVKFNLAVLQPERKPIHPRLREVLSGVNFTFIDPVSREFLKQALLEGVHLTTPPGMNSERWITYRNIFGTFISSHATLGQVGKIYGISRERVRQINEEVLEKLFPENKISLKKASRYRPKEWLLVKDTLGSEIIEFLEQGLSADQIMSRFDTSSSRGQAIKALKLLREAGFDIKRIKNVGGEYLRIEQELLKEDLTDEEIQSLLDQINSMQGVRLLLHSRKVIIPIRGLLLSIGFHYRVNKITPFYDALIDAGIPLGMTGSIVQSGPQKGKQYYYFIAAQHRYRGEEVLKANPALARFLENPVKQVSGPDTQIPTTTLIMNKRGIVSIRSILNEFSIPSSSRGEKIKQLGEDLKIPNQVPLFVYKGTTYTLEADIQKVRGYIKATLEAENS